MTAPSHSARARSFNAAAARYAANRPSYPPALLDAVEELAGRPLAGARVADIGAGTGIATAGDVPWIAEQAERIERFFGSGQASKSGAGGIRTELAFAGAPEVPDHTHRVVRWSRTVPVDTHLANIGSHSVFLVLGEEGANSFLAEEREHLLKVFPGGLVEEVYDAVLIVATRP